MNKRYLVALDQGTTSSRAVVFTPEGEIVDFAQREFRQIYPQPGWVEHNPEDILFSQVESLRMAVRKAGIDPEEIAAIGITNQRETTLLWDKQTGVALHNAIVWQCRRTASMVDKLKEDGHFDMIRQKTGLVCDAYFSGTKLKWLLDRLGVQDRAEKGELCFGTVDSFLAYHLVKGHPHVTDASNASRTMLYNVQTGEWDDDLLSLLSIPRAVLPQVVDTSRIVGMLDESILGCAIPVGALVGDQSAALFGQACLTPGMAKNTYGTGCFMLMNMGDTFRLSRQGLLSTVAWRLNGKTTYAFEGSVFMGGATVQWLRDEMKLLDNAGDCESVARSVPDSGGAYLVPAFTGLGAPHWDMYARGTLVGMTRGTGRAQIIRAALESIAYQCTDLYHAMANEMGCHAGELRVDGGASGNAFLMQFQADMLGVPLHRPWILETTARGAAMLAGIAAGLYDSPEDAAKTWRPETDFAPLLPESDRRKALAGWQRAVKTALFYADLAREEQA